MYSGVMVYAALGIIIIILAIIRQARPLAGELSQFELERRRKLGDESARVELVHREWRDSVAGVFDLDRFLLTAGFAMVSLVRWGWAGTLLVSLIGGLVYLLLSRLGVVARIAAWLYQRSEPKLVSVFEWLPWLGRLFGSKTIAIPEARLGSKEELASIIKNLKGVLTPAERVRLLQGLTFSDKRVSDVMTPRAGIISIEPGEVLGPLTLDRLYKSGHAVLPVIEAGADSVCGMLYTKDKLIATSSATSTVRQAMTEDVITVHETDSLEVALQKILQTHQYLLVVRSQKETTLGIISLGDIVGQLTARSDQKR